MPPIEVISPQPGPQERFLSTPADIALFGGGNFGGKTYGLILDSVRHVNNGNYEAVFFRRETPQITNPGGLWQDAQKLYKKLGARTVTSPRHEARFRTGAGITFSHMQHEADRLNWDGAQIAGIYFDQLEQFTELQFWFMLSRNRSMSGIRPYMRMSCNPLPDSWLAQFIQWYWDPKTGYPIPERSGVIRWFVRIDDVVYWGDSPEELIARFPPDDREERMPKSFTYISANIYDNPIGTKANPEYLANLLALPLVEREQRLKMNWKIKRTGDGIFKEHWFKYIDERPVLPKWVRLWDIAGSDSADADYTAGALCARDGDRFIIADIARGQWTPGQRDAMMRNTAVQDAAWAERNKTTVLNYFFKGRGIGADMTRAVLKCFDGFSIHAIPERGSKLSRADPVASKAETGNVYLVRGEWNAAFVSEACSFTGEDSDDDRKDDQVDAVSGGHAQCVRWN